MGFLTVLTLLGVLIGCSQTPFPGEPLEKNRQPRLATQKYGLNFEQPMEFTEGLPAEFVIETEVPDGTAVISAEGLPQGAQLLDGSPPKISWTPPLGSSQDPKHPVRGYAIYRVRLGLRSSLDPEVIIKKSAIFIVNAK